MFLNLKWVVTIRMHTFASVCTLWAFKTKVVQKIHTYKLLHLKDR